MELPFTVDQFFSVFERYNHAVWPLQVVLLLLALAAIVLVVRPHPRSGVAISLILAVLWMWMGLVYHGLFFADINSIARAFAGLSIAGALVFSWVGGVRRKLRFERPQGWRALIGWSLVAYSLIVYPAWLWRSGHDYFASPTFGVPCPTTIFSIGMLSLAAPPIPRVLFVVPLIWSLIGGQAAFRLGVPQDIGLIAAGVLGAIVAWLSKPPARS